MKPLQTLLIVDDEPGIRRSLGESLSDEGYAVLKAERGEQALELLGDADGEGIHLMLLDVWLPGMDGLEVLRRAKGLRPELPVVMVSGHASIDTALQATRLGAFDFLEKPVELPGFHRLLLELGSRPKRGETGILEGWEEPPSGSAGPSLAMSSSTMGRTDSALGGMPASSAMS